MKTETTTPTAPAKKRPVRVFSAKEKSQAVLSLWSGRRSAAALMKELEVPWGMLHGWEQRAIAGILTALDPGWQQTPAQLTSLPARVEKLIAQTLVPKPAPAPATPN
jgi:hypothetical protein